MEASCFPFLHLSLVAQLPAWGLRGQQAPNMAADPNMAASCPSAAFVWVLKTAKLSSVKVKGSLISPRLVESAGKLCLLSEF